jgi:hypothetical protein
MRPPTSVEKKTFGVALQIGEALGFFFMLLLRRKEENVAKDGGWGNGIMGGWGRGAL